MFHFPRSAWPSQFWVNSHFCCFLIWIEHHGPPSGTNSARQSPALQHRPMGQAQANHIPGDRWDCFHWLWVVFFSLLLTLVMRKTATNVRRALLCFLLSAPCAWRVPHPTQRSPSGCLTGQLQRSREAPDHRIVFLSSAENISARQKLDSRNSASSFWCSRRVIFHCDKSTLSALWLSSLSASFSGCKLHWDTILKTRGCWQFQAMQLPVSRLVYSFQQFLKGRRVRIGFIRKEINLLFFFQKVFIFLVERMTWFFSCRTALEGEMGKDTSSSYRHSWSDHKHLPQPDTAVSSVVGSRHHQVTQHSSLADWDFEGLLYHWHEWFLLQISSQVNLFPKLVTCTPVVCSMFG